jgi:hypothetical protein
MISDEKAKTKTCSFWWLTLEEEPLIVVLLLYKGGAPAPTPRPKLQLRNGDRKVDTCATSGAKDSFGFSLFPATPFADYSHTANHITNRRQVCVPTATERLRRFCRAKRTEKK